MKIDIKKILDRKEIHIAIIVTIIIVLLFIATLVILKYNVEGETNLPFNISKITIISSVEGTDSQNAENKWNLNVDQNNDIYMYIEKNKNYKDTEIIEKITLENFNIENQTPIGDKKNYRPDINTENSIFKNNDENIIDRIEYIGTTETNIKNLEISNQGGLIVFRCSNTNVGQYTSNDDEEINHSELLNKLNISKENISFNVTFDMHISLKNGTNYKANIKLELPVGDIVNNGTQSKEITDLQDIVFKRE